MGKNGLLLLLLKSLLFVFFLLFLLCGCDGRKLSSDPDPNQDPNVHQDSKLSSPPPDAKKPNPSPADVTKPKDDPTTNPSNTESKELNDANNKKTPGDKVKPKVENQTPPKTFDTKSCNGNAICNDQDKTMIACVQDFDNGSKNLTLLVQNERDIDLKVNIAFGTSSTDKNLTEFKIPGHGTEKINITFPGDKSMKVILNAGNGDCELQIDQPKTTPVDTPPKSKDPENIVDSPTKPDNVNNSTDNKSKDENDPSKAKEVEGDTKPKNADDPSKSKDDNDSSKSKDQNDPSKSKDDSDPSKSKDETDPSKSKDDSDPSKSKDDSDPSKSKDDTDPSKSKDDSDPSKSKDQNDPSKPKDDTDPSKSKDNPDPSKSKNDTDPSKKSKNESDPSKSKDQNTPRPKPTPTNVHTPISQNNILDQLTFYSKQVTPIYGAYFAFLIALIVGASWALCSFRKRRTDNGVPYQELEMALPESSNAADVETAQGWDQDWDDDDWDEDKAITSPGGKRGQTRSISSNGLTSRATKKDGWDADWDD